MEVQLYTSENSSCFPAVQLDNSICFPTVNIRKM